MTRLCDLLELRIAVARLRSVMTEIQRDEGWIFDRNQEEYRESHFAVLEAAGCDPNSYGSAVARFVDDLLALKEASDKELARLVDNLHNDLS